MLAYSFDHPTGYYLGETPCQPDPLAGGFLLPAGATWTAPPEFSEGQIPRWTGTAWIIEGLGGEVEAAKS